MKLHSGAVATLLAGLVCLASTAGATSVTASVDRGEFVISDTGVFHARVSDLFEDKSLYAEGSVSAAFIKALATASSLTNDVQATVSAEWTDTILLAVPPPFPLTGYTVRFSPTVSGSITDSAEFSFFMEADWDGRPDGPAPSAGLGAAGELLGGSGPQVFANQRLSFVVPLSAFLSGVNITSSLNVRAVTALHVQGGVQQADFWHTVTLPPVQILDSEGNIVDLNLDLVGLLGDIYTGQADVPEPATLPLAGVAVSYLLLLRLRHRPA